MAKFLSITLLLTGIGLLYLANLGVLSIRKPYLFRLSETLPALDPVVAFSNVNIVPMNRERVLENQTVIVRDGKVAALGESDQIEVPE